ncbi:MAG: type II secretion system protein F [Parcubacteria group bacterium GW2011_GWD2_38_12]|nr:MAG: type II secretion system protein F [Parcubacteria group bacterium GW2011_GWD2_38_12]
MPLYNYNARTSTGEEKKGQMEARDEFDLANILRKENIFLIYSKPVTSTQKAQNLKNYISKIRGSLKFSRSIPVSELMVFSKNLSVMIGAGLALTRALEVLSKQTTNEILKTTLADVTAEVQKGKTFSDSLAMHQGAFSDLYINMVRSAEAAGNLEDILKLLAKQLKKEYDLKRRVKGAFMYPLVILVAMTGIGVLMMLFVVPSLAKTFKDLGVPLPLSTRVIIAIAEFGINYWYFFIAIISGSIYSSVLFSRTAIGKNLIDILFLKLPLIGSLTKKINSARFARTLSSLLEGGVPILKSLEIISKTIPNHYYRDSLKTVIDEVRKGKTLSESLEKYPELYPPLVTQMIAVGEETGAVSDILKRLAVFFETETTQTTKNMATIIEPFLMIIIGVIVGLFAISMMQPMYSK